MKTFAHIFTLYVVCSYIYVDTLLMVRLVKLRNLLQFSIWAKNIQSEKVQRTHVKSLYSNTDYTLLLLL
jgi:hypothetical protein